MKMKHVLTVLLTLVFLLGMLTGCSLEASSDAMMNGAGAEKYDGVYDSAEGESVKPESSSGESAGVQAQKLIRTMNLDVETDDMDKLLGDLSEKISAQGGYVQSKTVRNGSTYSDRSYRYAELTVRVPAEQMDAFVEHISGASNVVYAQENAEDVTLRYVATQSRITALETEQARLVELLAQAENMEDLLTIEQRLTDVHAELEEVTSQLRLYDNLVDYATIQLSITEVKEYTVIEEEEETVWQRIGKGFMESLSDLWTGITEVLIFLITKSPYLLLLGGIAVLIVFLVKRRRRK